MHFGMETKMEVGSLVRFTFVVFGSHSHISSGSLTTQVISLFTMTSQLPSNRYPSFHQATYGEVYQLLIHLNDLHNYFGWEAGKLVLFFFHL